LKRGTKIIRKQVSLFLEGGERREKKKSQSQETKKRGGRREGEPDAVRKTYANTG